MTDDDVDKVHADLGPEVLGATDMCVCVCECASVSVCECESPSHTHLAYDGAPVVDQLRQHHGHVMIDSGGMVRPLRRVAHERAQGEHGRTAYLHVSHMCLGGSLGGGHVIRVFAYIRRDAKVEKDYHFPSSRVDTLKSS